MVVPRLFTVLIRSNVHLLAGYRTLYVFIDLLEDWWQSMMVLGEMESITHSRTMAGAKETIKKTLKDHGRKGLGSFM